MIGSSGKYLADSSVINTARDILKNMPTYVRSEEPVAFDRSGIYDRTREQQSEVREIDQRRGASHFEEKDYQTSDVKEDAIKGAFP